MTKHQNMVSLLAKNPYEIAAEMSPRRADLIHAILGIAGEAGELVDAIKKHTIYNKDLDRDNIVEELGDMEFYLEQLRQAIGISREETLEANMTKLEKRYPGYKYTDTKASERLDKQV